MSKDKSLIILDRFIEIFLLILIFTIPFPRHKQTIEIICFVFIILLWIAKLFLQSERKIKGSSIDLPIIIFTFFILLSVFFPHNPMYSLDAFRKFWLKPLLLFYIIVNFVNSKEKLKRLIWIVIISSLFPIVMGVAEFFMRFPCSRLVSLFPGPNQYGEYLGTIILFLTGILLWSKDIKSKIILNSIIVVSIFPLIFTYSRGSWISVFAGIIFLLFWKNKKIASVVLITSILMGSVFIYLFSPVQLRGKEITEMETVKEVCKWVLKTKRLYRWETVIHEIRKKPLTGIGFGPNNFKRFYPQIKRCEKFKDVVHTHNYYLEIAVESGIIALIVFLWLWITLLRRIWKGFKRTPVPLSKGCLAGVFGVLFAKTIHWLVEVPHDQQLILTMWLFIGIAMAIERNISSIKLQEEDKLF